MEKYNLAARTRWLQDEPTGKVGSCATEPARPYAAFIVKIPGGAQPQTLWRRVAEPDFVCHFGQVATSLHADVFIAHFGPAG